MARKPRNRTSNRRTRIRAFVAGALLLPLAATGAGTPGLERDPVLPRTVPRAVPSPIAPPAPLLPRIVVNVPAYRLDVFLAGERQASYPITIGMPRLPTPRAELAIRELIWNPWWHPPAHRRPKDKVTPPGPRNPMGRVKLHLTKLLYIHGTANLRDIGRAASRACVRMSNEDAISLARLVQAYAGADLPPAELDELVREPRRTRRVRLAQPVPVELAYRPVELRDGMVEVHRDVYRRLAVTPAQLVVATLARAGTSPERVDAAAVETLLAGSVPVRFSVGAVLRRDWEAKGRAVSGGGDDVKASE